MQSVGIIVGDLPVQSKPVLTPYLKEIEAIKTCDIRFFVKKGNLSFTAMI